MMPYLIVIGIQVLVSLACFSFYFAIKTPRSRPPSVKCVRKNYATVCSWCASGKAGTEWAVKRNLIPTHTICPDCRAKILI